ncbi:MAG TPA: methyl-accepting chemotaxis protein [Kofleriaceae bacterium]
MCLLGFAAFAIVAKRTLDETQVKGPLYGQIIDAKDVIADVLPPPKYIIESYLIVLQLTEETNPTEIARLKSRSLQLKTEYETQHQYWTSKSAVLPDKIRTALLVTSHAPAEEFFKVRDNEFMPLIDSQNRDAARKLANDRMKTIYNEHRVAVDDVVSLSRDYAAKTEARAEASTSSSEMWLVILGLCVAGLVIVMGVVTYRIATSLTRRIAAATAAASQVADGDLTVTVPPSDDDETGKLLSAIRMMTESLNSLVKRVKKASIELMSTSTQFAATNKQQEATVNSFGASTNEIAAAVREISATSQELLSTMEGVNRVAVDTATLAGSGRSALTTMDTTMRDLSRSTGSISSKLSAIREKAADINMVVTTITKVADQTNLLSVNAAIEAEKAGEYGLGFIVLAREIRRLADQTAVATLDIDEIVKQMQGAVSAGVMEMDKFTEDVRKGVGTVEGIGAQLEQIIGSVQNLTQSFESVAEAMRAQSQGAVQINDAMVQLTQGARQTSSSLKEFDNATTHLRDAVQELKQEISHFKVVG